MATGAQIQEIYNMETAVFIIYAIVVYGAVPAIMIWGWIRWANRPQPRTLAPILTFVGFVLATLSALLAISTALYARFAGGFRYYDPTLMKIYGIGSLLSLAGLAAGLGGVWRSSAVRWHAPVCALGTLMFWVMAAASE